MLSLYENHAAKKGEILEKSKKSKSLKNTVKRMYTLELRISLCIN